MDSESSERSPDTDYRKKVRSISGSFDRPRQATDRRGKVHSLVLLICFWYPFLSTCPRLQ